MSIDLKKFSGVKYLNLTGGGGGGGGGGGSVRKNEYLMIGALIIIIGGSLAFTILRLTSSSGPGDRTPPEIWFHCDKCKHEFKLEREGKEMFEMMDEMGMSARDCPKCGEKKCCYQMTKCPKCGKYYPSPAAKYWADMYRTGKEHVKGEKPPKSICPHCHTDRDAYIREMIRKKRGK